MKRKAQLVLAEPRTLVPPAVPDALRGWIEQVIVPILVDQYLRKKGVQSEESDG